MKSGLTAKDLRLTHKYMLTAAECDARGTISPALMTERIIEVATQHANLLGIGYADLSQHGIGWVLSRMALCMQRWPRFNRSFALHTWIEDVNRLYSTRCMRITGEDGDTIGEARTIWAAINTADRTPADISILGLDSLVIGADGISVPRPDASRHAQQRTYAPPILGDTPTSTSTDMSIRYATSRQCSTSGRWNTTTHTA